MNPSINSIISPSLKTPKHSFGLLTGYIFAINCIVGAGFLGIPWAYSNAGWLFCFFYQIFISIQSFYLSLQLLESMSRAEVLLRKQENGEILPKLAFKQLFLSPPEETLLSAEISQEYKPEITNRVINCADLCKLAFGDKVGKGYIICLFLYIMGTMVAYAAIFSSSFVSNVPLGTLDTCDIYSYSGFYNDCRWKYWIFLFLFSVITVYMTVKGIEEQQIIQIIMSILRLISLMLIILTCIVSISTHKKNDGAGYNSAEMPPLINPLNIGHAIPIILFASSYQVHIPTISESISNKTKNLPTITLLTAITCFVFYSVLGILASVAIEDIPSMASLGYRNYTGGYSRNSRPAWSYIIEYLIIISPALDVLTCFPIKALTIADSIVTWKYGGDLANVNKWVLFCVRSGVTALPLIVSFVVFNLGKILDWVGLLGFVIVQIPIPMLHLAFKHLVPGRSDYDVRGGVWLNWGLIFVNVVLFFVVIGFNLSEY